MRPPPRVALRTEAGGFYGSGHLIRALALADELRASAQVRFIVSSSCAGRERIVGSGYALDVLSEVCGGCARDETVDTLRAREIDVLVTDFDGIDPEYVRAVRAALPSLRIVSLDDFSVPPDVPHVLVRPHAVEAWRPAPRANVHWGPRYWVLRRDFDRYLRDPRAPGERVERVLVMMGGAAPGASLAALMRSIGEAPGSPSLDIVCGPLCEGSDRVEDAASSLGARARVHRDPRDLPAIIASVDLAVTAGGYSLYELAALGIPAVAVAQVEHQRATLRALERCGTLLAVWSGADDGFAGVGDAVHAVMADARMRRRMSALGRLLVDGKGRTRVADLVLDRGAAEKR